MIILYLLGLLILNLFGLTEETVAGLNEMFSVNLAGLGWFLIGLVITLIIDA